MVPEIKFALLSHARSGTTLAIDLLNQHPDIYAHLEIFAKDDPGRRLRQEFKDEFGVPDVHGDPLGFLETVLSYTPGQRCVGFKMWQVQSQEAFDAVLKDPSIHKIIHQRTNYLASLSSREIAQATGMSHIITKEDQENYDGKVRPVLRFDPEKLRRVARRRRFSLLSALEQAVGPTLVTSHIDLVSNGTGKIHDFLGLPPFEPEHRFKKVNSANILDRYHPDDHALILETLEDMGVPEWVDEAHESHIVTATDRDAVKAVRRAKKIGQPTLDDTPRWVSAYGV